MELYGVVRSLFAYIYIFKIFNIYVYRGIEVAVGSQTTTTNEGQFWDLGGRRGDLSVVPR